MPLGIRFGIEPEKRRLENTLAKLDWYDSHGYRVRFPAGIDPRTAQFEEIVRALEREFDIEDYRKASAKIRRGYSSIEPDLVKALEEATGRKAPSTFEVILTKYGTGGSYNLSNRIILNINNRHPIETLVHEICHILLEPDVKKRGTIHEKKEKAVDSLFGKIQNILKRAKT